MGAFSMVKRIIQIQLRPTPEQAAALEKTMDRFHQACNFIAYKAQQAGVKLLLIDPKHTSQMCAQCGHVERANRSCQARFCCNRCRYNAHADYNAARNIRARDLVNEPIVSAAAATAAG